MFAFCLFAFGFIKFSRAVAQHVLHSLSLPFSLSLNLSPSLSLSLSILLSISHSLSLSLSISVSLSRKNFDEDVLGVAKDLVRGAVSLHREVMMNFRKTAQNFHYEVCDMRYSSFSSALILLLIAFFLLVDSCLNFSILSYISVYLPTS